MSPNINYTAKNSRTPALFLSAIRGHPHAPAPRHDWRASHLRPPASCCSATGGQHSAPAPTHALIPDDGSVTAPRLGATLGRPAGATPHRPWTGKGEAR